MKEKEILNFMKELGISYEEATQLWEDDHSGELLPEVEELETKAKENRIYVKGDKRKEKKEKIRKIDNIKKNILEGLAEALPSEAQNIRFKNEVEINFILEDAEYTLKLIRHRKKKK